MKSEMRYWSSIEEKRGLVGPEPNEFAAGALDGEEPGRRDFLKLLGTAAAATGLAGCLRNPPEHLLPYGKQPDELVPGNPLHYATTLSLDGYGLGVVVAAREGRPIKVEGNPEHPSSMGGTSAFEQAAIYQLYDPQRAKQARISKKRVASSSFLTELGKKAQKLKDDGGAKLRFLVEPTGSPLEVSLRDQLKAQFPNAKWYAWSPVGSDAGYQATTALFGKPLETRLELDKARVILALDSDFLGEGPHRLVAQRQFADHRVPENGLNRLYVAEAAFSITGAAADHRLRLKPSEIRDLALAVLAQLAPERSGGLNGGHLAQDKFVKAVVADLKKAGAQGVVIAGKRQPMAVHALAAAINAALGSTAVSYTAPVLADTAFGTAQLKALADEIKAGAVETLVITAYNPVYTGPSDLDLAALLDKVPNVIYRGMFDDETARHAGWFVPAAHDLEVWGDARGTDGTVSLQQPLINPLFNGISAAELYAGLLGRGADGGYRLLRAEWAQKQAGAPTKVGGAEGAAGAPTKVGGAEGAVGGFDFETWWDRTVQRGVVDGTALAPEAVTPAWDKLTAMLAAPSPGQPAGLEVNLVPCAKLYDGRFADNAWLQELPETVTKLCWGNAALISPKTADRLEVKTEDRVEIALGGKRVVLPALVQVGHADDSITLWLGYGRQGAEVIARDVGSNAYPLRTVEQPWFSSGATLSKAGGKTLLAVTQKISTMDNRPVALEVAAGDLPKKRLPLWRPPEPGREPDEKFGSGDGELEYLDQLRGSQQSASMFPPHEYNGYKWAMSIDMSRCTGCGACVVACASENNVLVVGREQVIKRREMLWLTIDRYYEGPEDDPTVVTQPRMCVQCENAPCEYVCPVNATVHSDEGLNDMVYNRCVGTRYCSNNCPYKVRHFNYLNWHNNLQGTEEMAMNPDVTVRARGVMEKCTYCVQRIERARITARVEGREIRENDFTTACAQSCASQAIVFGSLHDPNQRTSKLHEDPRSYQMLHELGTQPRTVHLVRVRNKNPELG